MLKTPLCELLGITYPVIQGGMAWVADAGLAAAVSNAGGLGLISAMNADAGWLRGQIETARRLTDKPFGVNIMLMSPHADEVAGLVAEMRVPVVTTGAGSPGKYMAGWLDAGIRVIPVVASCALAKRMERYGACAVIAEGTEAGGHIGEITTMALVPQVVDSVSIPVVAAGGIADGRGMAAALMLGAQGVQMGTRFLVAEECRAHPEYKRRVLEARDIDTVVTGRRTGHPVRSLKTPFTRTFQALEQDEHSTLEQMEALGSGALRRAVEEGDAQQGCVMAGQASGLVTKAQPAKEIVEEVCAQAEKRLRESRLLWEGAL